MSDTEYKRPRLRQQPTGSRLESLKDDIEDLIDQKEIRDSRFIGPNGNVSDDRIIYEALKLLKAKKIRGDLDL